MSMRNYRLAVIGCALSWFLLGMHAPLVHELTAHGRLPATPILIAVGVVAALALAGLVALLRAPSRGTR